MKIRTVSLLILLALSQYMVGQNNYDTSIMHSFKSYKQAVLTVDYDKILKFTHPNIVKMSGGANFYLEEVINDYNMYSRAGLKLKNLEAKQSSKVLVEHNNMQAMLPYVKTFETDTQFFKEEHFYFLTSYDNGESWHFTDMKKYGVDDIKVFIPEYNERLNIYINSLKH